MSVQAGVKTTGGKFYVRFDAYNKKAVDAAKNIDGRTWNKEATSWCYPATPAAAVTIYETLRGVGARVFGDDKFIENLAAIMHVREVLSGRVEPIVPPFETDLPRFRHQLLGYDLIRALPGMYLGHEMGTGKSRIVVDAVCGLGMKRVLIVCPRSVMVEWPRQFERHGDGSVACVPLERGSVAKRTKDAEKALLLHKRVAIVVNYDAVWRFPFGAEVETKGNKQRVIKERGFALRTQWDMIVGDELHRCKEGRSKVGWFFRHLREVSVKCVGLSGTPIPNTPMDLWSQMLFVDPGVFGGNFVAFRTRYAVMGGFQKRQVVNFRNLELMNRRFALVSHRVTKEEALDLPPEMDEERSVTLGSEAVQTYRNLEASFIAKVRHGEISVRNALTELLRLQQLTGGFVKLDTGEGITVDEEKANALGELLGDLPPTEPIVVFCRFHHDLEAVSAAAEKLGRSYAELSQRQGRPAEGLREWQAGGNGPTVIGIQVQSGGLGIDCTRARYAVFYSLGFSPGEYNQARSRLHRQGQQHKVTYVHLIVRGCSATGKTIDERVYAALRRKAKINEKALSEAEGADFVVQQITSQITGNSSLTA